jgi:hypothetical protein
MAAPTKSVQHLQNTGHHWLEKDQAQPAYAVQEFPKTMHHKDGSTATVFDPAGQAKLGSDWEQSPAIWADRRAKEAADKDAKDKAAADKADAKDSGKK